MPKLVTNIPSAALIEELDTGIRNLRELFKPFNVPIATGKKRNMALLRTSRRGLGELVCSLAKAKPNALSRMDDPAELEALLQYQNQILALSMATVSLHEMMVDTLCAVSGDAMVLTIAYRKALELHNKNYNDIDMQLEEIRNYYKRYVNKKHKRRANILRQVR